MPIDFELKVDLFWFENSNAFLDDFASIKIELIDKGEEFSKIFFDNILNNLENFFGKGFSVKDAFKEIIPVEFNDSLELTSIIEQNDNDTITAAFNRTLLNDGYQEHISNKVIDNSQV